MLADQWADLMAEQMADCSAGWMVGSSAILKAGLWVA